MESAVALIFLLAEAEVAIEPTLRDLEEDTKALPEVASEKAQKVADSVTERAENPFPEEVASMRKTAVIKPQDHSEAVVASEEVTSVIEVAVAASEEASAVASEVVSVAASEEATSVIEVAVACIREEVAAVVARMMKIEVITITEVLVLTPLLQLFQLPQEVEASLLTTHERSF